MYTIFLIIYLLVAIILVLLVMLQHGRGMDIGSDSFNIRGALRGWNTDTVGGFVTRLITILGLLFFFLSLLLGNISNKYYRKEEHNISQNHSLKQVHDDDNKINPGDNVSQS